MITVNTPDGKVWNVPTDDREKAIAFVHSKYKAQQAATAATSNGISAEPQSAEQGKPGLYSLAGELASGFNRTIAGGADWLVGEPLQAGANALGFDVNIPSLEETLTEKKGAFAGQGVATDISAGAGEGAAMAASMGGAFTSLALKFGKGAAQNILKMMGGNSLSGELALGAVSGAGEAGGRAIGGEGGALAGSLAAPMVGQSLKNASSGALDIIDDAGRSVYQKMQGLGTKNADEFSNASNYISQKNAAAEKAAQAQAAEVERLKQPLSETFAEQAELNDLNFNSATADIQKDQAKATFDGLSSGNLDEVALSLDLDKNAAQAIKDLNIDVKPYISYISNNPVVIGIAEQLKTIGANKMLDEDSRKFVQAVADRADKAIMNFGGDTSKSDLNVMFKSEFGKRVDEIAEAENVLYKQASKVIDFSNKTQPEAVKEWLERKAVDLGGTDNLPAPMKSIYKNVVEKETPTIGYLDLKRKEIGQALSGKDSPFKSEEQGILKQLYGVLRQDVDSGLAQFEGGLEITKAANKLTIKRKIIEEAGADLMGKKLAKTITEESAKQVKGLIGSKANSEGFRAFTNNIAKIDPRLRQKVVVSAFGEIMGGPGAGQQALNTNSFVKFMEDLNRNPESKKELYRHIPKGFKRDVENLYIVAKKINRAKQDKIPTGVVNTLFKDSSGLVDRLMNVAAPITSRVTGAMPGGNVAADMVSNVKNFVSGESDKAKAAGDMLASPKFKAMIDEAVTKGLDSKEMNKIEDQLSKTKAYKKWSATLSKEQGARIGRIGLSQYFLAEDK